MYKKLLLQKCLNALHLSSYQVLLFSQRADSVNAYRSRYHLNTPNIKSDSIVDCIVVPVKSFISFKYKCRPTEHKLCFFFLFFF